MFSQNQPEPPTPPTGGGDPTPRNPIRGRVTVRWSIRRVTPGGGPPNPPQTPTPPPNIANQPGDPRLNLLLTYGGWRESSWADCLPTLLEPMGVRTFRATSGAEATQVLRTVPIHAAVVDLRLPLDRCAAANRIDATPAAPAEEGGERLLEVLRRLDAPPPTVVVTRDRTPRERMRELHNALRHGAYAVVLGNAADAEQMLRVLQRLVTRYYQNRWPAGTLPNPEPPPPIN
jgi:CheY-like chemotaxis protein